MRLIDILHLSVVKKQNLISFCMFRSDVYIDYDDD